jgi:hypothetical protein
MIALMRALPKLCSAILSASVARGDLQSTRRGLDRNFLPYAVFTILRTETVKSR